MPCRKGPGSGNRLKSRPSGQRSIPVQPAGDGFSGGGKLGAVVPRGGSSEQRCTGLANRTGLRPQTKSCDPAGVIERQGHFKRRAASR